jgi:leucyl/phenylalanyl-tRNA--protein transferase
MLFFLDPDDPAAPFPAVDQAQREPNGLLAVGGDLSLTRLLNAYRSGIFPWYSAGQPILWWSPDPRLVLFPQRLKISRSLHKALRNRGFRISLDRDFRGVIQACAAPRQYEGETWITKEMLSAYESLHHAGHAHSVEVWLGEELVGGLYGVTTGSTFFGESMFSSERDASKVALVCLARHLSSWGYKVIDCQVYSQHLVSLGAEEINRSRFIEILRDSVDDQVASNAWNKDLARPVPVAEGGFFL